VAEPDQRDFENLLGFRVALRRFQRWSEDPPGMTENKDATGHGGPPSGWYDWRHWTEDHIAPMAAACPVSHAGSVTWARR
jgi:hypothetical protein